MPRDKGHRNSDLHANERIMNMNDLTPTTPTQPAIDPTRFAGIETQDAEIVIRDKYTQNDGMSAHRQASELLEAALRVNENDLAATLKMLQRIHKTLTPIKPRRA